MRKMKNRIQIISLVTFAIFALHGCAKEIKLTESKVDDCTIVVNIENSTNQPTLGAQLFQSPAGSEKSLYLSILRKDLDERKNGLEKFTVNLCEKTLQVESPNFYASYWYRYGQEYANRPKIDLNSIDHSERSQVEKSSPDGIQALEKLNTKRPVLENQNYELDVLYYSTKEPRTDISKQYFCVQNHTILLDDNPIENCSK